MEIGCAANSAALNATDTADSLCDSATVVTGQRWGVEADSATNCETVSGGTTAVTALHPAASVGSPLPAKGMKGADSGI
jgi:hypothetical protein